MTADNNEFLCQAMTRAVAKGKAASRKAARDAYRAEVLANPKYVDAMIYDYFDRHFSQVVNERSAETALSRAADAQWKSPTGFGLTGFPEQK